MNLIEVYYRTLIKYVPTDQNPALHFEFIHSYVINT